MKGNNELYFHHFFSHQYFVESFKQFLTVWHHSFSMINNSFKDYDDYASRVIFLEELLCNLLRLLLQEETIIEIINNMGQNMVTIFSGG